MTAYCVGGKRLGSKVTVRRPNILVGTSGWSYRSWRGVFFPTDLPARDQLEFYAKRFPTTELNGVFYRTPTIEAVQAWANRTPRHFVFSWKASKFITHWKRLGDNSRNSLVLMESRLKALGTKAGPVLFQLPPQFKKDRERLASFLKLLSAKRSYAFEFRHPSWYAADIFNLLRDDNIALCISDHHDAPAPWEVTARHIYIRAHGPEGRYGNRYPRKALQFWARTLKAHFKKGHTVYVYFDNDQKSAAPLDAAALIKLLGEEANR